MGIAYGANYGRPSLDLNFARNKSLIDTISGQNLVTFSRAQANYLTTYVGSDGLIKYARADEPRFDHDPVTGESLGLLIEESKTNLVTRSQEFNSSPWSASGVITANANTAPDGTVTADQVSSGRIERYDISYTSGVTYTFSVFVKGTAGQTVGIGKLVAGSDGDVILSYTTLNGTWQRLIYTFTSAATASGSRVIISGSGDKSGTATNFLVWGAQLEAGSFPTSYIPTDGTPGGKTRSADEASITGTNFSRWYNQSEGTLFTKRSATQTTAGNFVPEWQICGASDNGPQLLDGLLFNNSSSFMSVNNFSAGSTAVAMKSNNFASSFNGGAVTTNTTEPMQTGRTFIRIGRQIGGNTTMMTTRFSRLTYYPTRLQNFQLQQLTK